MPLTYPWAIRSLITYFIPLITIVSFEHKQPILKMIAQPKLFILDLCVSLFIQFSKAKASINFFDYNNLI